MDIKKLVQQMTLEEKAAMCSGTDFWCTLPIERLGIPSVMFSDGPHGLRKQEGDGDHLGLKRSIQAVCFPSACATACSFDRAVLEKMGSILGKECQDQNVSVLLGPGVNIKRSPLCGRNFEYLSEDPYLAGELAASYINGVQSQHVGTSIKHFAANNQEFERRVSSSEIDERTLREIYLLPFEIAVKKAQPWTVMCAYNQVNGVQASEHKELLRDILKEEWGFEGFVISDWGAVCDRVKGVLAGMDLEMPGTQGINDREIIDSVKTGILDKKILDDNIERILKVIFKYIENHKKGTFDRKKDHNEAVEIAKQCVVLLKNERVYANDTSDLAIAGESILPLKKGQPNIAFIGGFTENPRYQGGGSSNINASSVPSYLEAVKSYAEVLFAKGFSHNQNEWEEELAKEAIATAKQAETVVIFAGLPDVFESEGYDRTHMRMPSCQNRLIEEICKINKKVIVVLQNGSPIEMPWIDQIQGLVEAYLGGEGIVEAVLQILFGAVNPCGKLAETFPLRIEDNPTYLTFPGIGQKAEYSEGVFIGYRYYDKKKIDVLFPFGFGLSYTTFSYGNLSISKTELKDSELLTVSVDVTNTGMRAGKEIVQLYVKDKTRTVYRPEQELKAFDTVYLEPGETKRVSMELNKRAFAWYHIELKDWYVVSGEYVIAVGKSSRQIEVEAKVQITSTQGQPIKISKNTTIGMLLENKKTRDYTRSTILSGCDTFTKSLKGSHSPETVEGMMKNWTIYSLRSFGGGTNEMITKYVEELNRLIE